MYSYFALKLSVYRSNMNQPSLQLWSRLSFRLKISWQRGYRSKCWVPPQKINDAGIRLSTERSVRVIQRLAMLTRTASVLAMFKSY